MGILDSSPIIKLQERLLAKADQNKILGQKLARVILATKVVAEVANIECYKHFISWTEDVQMVVGGRTRLEYLKALDSLVPEFKKEDNK